MPLRPTDSLLLPPDDQNTFPDVLKQRQALLAQLPDASAPDPTAAPDPFASAISAGYTPTDLERTVGGPINNETYVPFLQTYQGADRNALLSQMGDVLSGNAPRGLPIDWGIPQTPVENLGPGVTNPETGSFMPQTPEQGLPAAPVEQPFVQNPNQATGMWQPASQSFLDTTNPAAVAAVQPAPCLLYTSDAADE